MSDERDEALRRLERRLHEASDAAERVIGEAARSARPRRPPPSGWQAPESDHGQRQPGAELELLNAAIQLARELVPPEVLERLAAALRELLMAMRALIDFYVERLERPRGDHDAIRDIPIE